MKTKMTMASQTSKDNKAEILYIFFKDIAKHNGIVDRRKGGFRPGAEEDPLYKSALATLEDRLSRGWSTNDIAMKILAAKDLRITTSHLYQILQENPPVSEREDQDLLQPLEKYRHPRLKKRTIPVCDYETGETISTGSQERIAKFTLGDLISYYISELDPPKVSRKDISLVLRYSLNNGIRLESILIAIDLWAMSTDIDRGRDPWILLREYVPQAIDEEREQDRNDDSNESVL